MVIFSNHIWLVNMVPYSIVKMPCMLYNKHITHMSKTKRPFGDGQFLSVNRLATVVLKLFIIKLYRKSDSIATRRLANLYGKRDNCNCIDKNKSQSLNGS